MSDAGRAPDPSSLAAHGSPASAPEVGQRLVVRVRTGHLAASGNPELTDVVGTVEQIVPAGPQRPERWLLLRRDGTLAEVDPATAVAVKQLPNQPARLRRAMAIATSHLEEIAARGWQPLESEWFEGWLLRAAEGFTGRANSVLPLGEPDLPLDQALTQVTQWYARRGLPAQFQVPLPWRKSLDDALARRGWTANNPTSVMVADVGDVLINTSADAGLPPVQWSHVPRPVWIDAYRYRGATLPPVAAAVLAMADQPVFAEVVDPENPDGPLLAVGRSALDEGWVGITALDVARSARRRGLGRHVTRALLEHAQQRGCRHAYLQVAAENAAARALYEGMGFIEHHTYHYRVEQRST